MMRKQEIRYGKEARAVMNLASTDLRNEYIQAIEKKRGTAEADRLRATVRTLWQARRAGAKAPG